MIKHDVDLDAVNLLTGLSAQDAIDAFRSGRADYVHLPHPQAGALVAEGAGQIAAALGPELGHICYSSFAAMPEYIDSNPGAIQSFVNGFDDALTWLASADNTEIAQRAAPFFPDHPQALLRDCISQYRANHTWPESSLITPQSYNAMRDILIDGGLVKARHPYDRLVMPRVRPSRRERLMRIPATIARIARQTPTIKSFDLDLGGRELGFKPGQWVDFFVTLEGAEAIGGYSITSSPSAQDSIGLAIKLDDGDHPRHQLGFTKRPRWATKWKSVSAATSYYTRDMTGPFVLIAGGIGLTPLMSVIRAIAESERSTPTTLIYSVSTPSEILFRQELEEIVRRNPAIKLVFTITRPGLERWDGHTGRIDADLLQDARVSPDSLFFLCGPPDMIRDVIGTLVELGAPGSQIKYEQWVVALKRNVAYRRDGFPPSPGTARSCSLPTPGATRDSLPPTSRPLS